jgi:hypothetical protein
MEDWLLMQILYHGLTNSTRENMDATARGAFLSLTIAQATALVEKMASNQGWKEEHLQTHMRGGGMHQLKEVNMLTAKMDLLMKRLEVQISHSATSREFLKASMYELDSHMYP